MRLSRIILVFLISVFISQCVFYYPNLPQIMASHFNGAGAADGWMDKNNFFLVEAGILSLIVFAVLILPYLIGKMPKSLLNIPNKEYWLNDERRAATLKIIGHFFQWFGAALLALFIGINQLVFRANLTGKNLPSLSWAIPGAFLIFVIVWVMQFFNRFKVRSVK